MLNRFIFPVLLSLAGALFFILPLTSVPKTEEVKNSTENYSGNNTFACHSETPVFNEKEIRKAELVHREDLFYLTLWIGGFENRITFILKNEEIKETSYALDQPTKRYASFFYHGDQCTYSSDDFYNGMLMIHKYDTINNIIAGSFEFQAFSDDCGSLVRVQEGKFDATYFVK